MVKPLRTWTLLPESIDVTDGTSCPMIPAFCILLDAWTVPELCIWLGGSSAPSCGAGSTSTVAEALTILPAAAPDGVHVTITL
jgi:hypothetical protein